MRVWQDKFYAVVTGDVIASSRLSADRRRALYEAMGATSKSLRTAFRSSIPADVEIFRGDSWQMMLTAPAMALRAALFYRAGLRSHMQSHKFDIRMAIAIGRISFIPGKRLTEGDGEAFRLSGTALDAMSNDVSMDLKFPDLPEERALRVIVRLIDSLASRWSDKQALAVTGALQGWKQDEIAKTCWKTPISQQAVAQHLSRAAWSSVETGVLFFEETVERAVEEHRMTKDAVVEPNG